MKLGELTRISRMTPHQYIDVIYAMAVHDPTNIDNCVPAARYPTHFGRPAPQPAVIRAGQDSVFNVFGSWVKTAEAFIIYEQCKMIVMNFHNGRQIARSPSIVISDSVAYNHKSKKSQTSYAYTCGLCIREGLGWANAYSDASVTYSMGMMEVSIASDRKRESYVLETNRLRCQLQTDLSGNETSTLDAFLSNPLSKIFTLQEKYVMSKRLFQRS